MIPMKSLRSGSHPLLLLHKHLKTHLMMMIVVTEWMTSILLLMTMSVQSRSLLLHQHPKELEASIMQVAPVSPAVMKTIKSAGQNAVITMPIIMKAPSPNPKKMMPVVVIVMKRMMRLSISPNRSLMMPLALVVVVVVVVVVVEVVVVVVVMRTSLMSTLLSPNPKMMPVVVVVVYSLIN